MRLSSFQSGHNITTSGNILPTQIRTVGTGKEVESPVIDRRPATGYSQNVLLHVSICRRSSLGTGSHSFSRSSHRGSNNYCSSFTDIVRGIVHGIVYDSVHDIVGDIVIVTRILDSDQAVGVVLAFSFFSNFGYHVQMENGIVRHGFITNGHSNTIFRCLSSTARS